MANDRLARFPPPDDPIYQKVAASHRRFLEQTPQLDRELEEEYRDIQHLRDQQNNPSDPPTGKK